MGDLFWRPLVVTHDYLANNIVQRGFWTITRTYIGIRYSRAASPFVICLFRSRDRIGGCIKFSKMKIVDNGITTAQENIDKDFYHSSTLNCVVLTTSLNALNSPDSSPHNSCTMSWQRHLHQQQHRMARPADSFKVPACYELYKSHALE